MNDYVLGRQHLMISVATVSVVLAPFLETAEGYVITAFIGVGIGALIPDVDAQDAAIFHENIRGLNGDVGEAVNNFLGPMLPYFGYATKYAIYKPAVTIFDFLTSDKYSFQEKHRTFSHSFLGVFTMTAVTGLYLTAILILLEIFAPLYLIVFLLSYMSGAFLHMLEDSCTVTGIAWNSPFSETKLKGQISTGKDIKKPRYFLYTLGALTASSFYISAEYTIYMPVVVIGSIIAVILSWLIFAKFIAKVEIKR